MSNPYSGLKDYQLWRRAISRVEPHLFDPVVSPRFQISRGARVATAGSCFAQHISRKLSQIGFNYFVTETGADLPAEERQRRNFGVFSARFGNLYTTAQLCQLFEEAFGDRIPLERAWRRTDGCFVDPYRPQVEPDGFGDEEQVCTAREEHLAAVRQMFLDCDVFVFTLGLTESWRSKRDGSVFPLAPGVSAGSFDPALYEAVNFTVTEVQHDLTTVLQKIKLVNPDVRVVLTVSPVPLIATFEDRSVMCSTTYSKAVLRVVVDQTTQAFDWVDYFPSYEIITGSNTGGRYYGADYREINGIGVAHAMRCFVKNYASVEIEAEMKSPTPTDLFQAQSGSNGIICDEETIAAVRS